MLWPSLNAALNGLSAVLLSVGWVCIRRRNVPAHRVCMVAAFGTSVLFLVSYLAYHLVQGHVVFAGPPTVRPFYLALLVSHTMLAALVPPLALVTLSRAAKQQFDRHRAIARWTLPIWLYVSVTGVLVYLMLYVLFPAQIAV